MWLIFLVWLVIVVGSECGCEFLCNGERSSGPRNARGALWHVRGPLAVTENPETSRVLLHCPCLPRVLPSGTLCFFPMSCMTTLCQFSCSFSLSLLSAPLGWSCPLLLSFHSQSPGSDTEETSFPPISHQEVPRLCSGNPATWKLHPQQAQPAFGFSFRGACMDSKPFNSFFSTPWCAAVCAAPILGRCPVIAQSQACCGWCSPYLPAQTHVRGREISEKKIRR